LLSTNYTSCLILSTLSLFWISLFASCAFNFYSNFCNRDSISCDYELLTIAYNSFFFWYLLKASMSASKRDFCHYRAFSSRNFFLSSSSRWIFSFFSSNFASNYFSSSYAVYLAFSTFKKYAWSVSFWLFSRYFAFV
jgi:hypothetical protein